MKEITGFTPGPWVTDIGEAAYVRAPDGGHIAIAGNLKGQYGAKGRRNSNEVNRNAALIAAAPELYAENARLTELLRESVELQEKIYREFPEVARWIKEQGHKE